MKPLHLEFPILNILPRPPLYPRRADPPQTRSRALARPFRRRNTSGRYVQAEDQIEERAVGDGAGTSDGDADLDDGPDCGVGVGPGRVDEGEAMEFGDAVDGDDENAGERARCQSMANGEFHAIG